MLSRYAPLVLVVWVLGCPQEVGRLPFAAEGQNATTLEFAGDKPLSLWSDLDVTYAGSPVVHYQVTLQNGEHIQTVECDPFDVATPINYTNKNGRSDRWMRYLGRMRCAVQPDPGATAVSATLQVDRLPEVFHLKRADLVFMQ